MKKVRKHVRKDEGGARRLIVDQAAPAPTVMAGGIGNVNASQYRLEAVTAGNERHTLAGRRPTRPLDEPAPTQTAVGNAFDLVIVKKRGYPVKKDDKPPFRVPMMAEVAALPFSGLTAVSTFSGCGGSSLGYRMAGFKVLWASEFVPAARDCYRANFPSTILDERDIRTVKPAEILKAIKLKKGQLDLLDGSPPCASFSTAGKRQEGWGKVKKYSDVEQRTDDLFFEFVRILEGLAPRVFVAENVSGLVKGVAKGYFLEILAALKGAGYHVACRVLDAQWLGVPQQRQRCIFVGVRKDMADAAGRPIQPVHPAPLPVRFSVLDAIPWLAFAEEDTGGEWGAGDVSNVPAPTVRAAGVGQLKGVGRVTVDEDQFEGRSRSADLPSPTIRQGRPGGMKVVAQGGNSGFGKIEPRSLDDPCPTVGTGPNSGNGRDGPGTFYVETVTAEGGTTSLAPVCHPTERRKFSIAELKRICAFPDDFVLTGSYAQQWERLGRAVPPVMMFWIAKTVRDEVLLKADGRKAWPNDPPCLLAVRDAGRPDVSSGLVGKKKTPGRTAGG